MNPLSRLLSTLVAAALALFATSCAKKETQTRAFIDTSHGMMVVKLLPDRAPKTVANFIGLADGTRLLAEGQDPAEAKPFYDGLTFHRVMPNFMIQGGDPAGDGSGGPGYAFEDETFLEQPIEGVIASEERASAVIASLLQPHLQKHDGDSPVPEIHDLIDQVRAQNSLEPLKSLSVEQVAEWVGHEGSVTQKVINGRVTYGTLCMANRGPNTNGSQFFIVTARDGCPWLDGKHTVFGEVVQGMDVAEAISALPTGPANRPLEPVTINSIRVKQVKIELPKETKS